MTEYPKYDYFFSYSRDIYSSIALELISSLENYKFRIWVDKTDVLLGNDIYLNINDVLNKTKLWKGAIVLIDESYLKKEWCLIELNYFLNNNVDILPVLYHLSKVDIPKEYQLLKSFNLARLDSVDDIPIITNRIIDAFLSKVSVSSRNIKSLNSKVLETLIQDLYYNPTQKEIEVIKIDNIILCIKALLQNENYNLKPIENSLFQIVHNKKNELFITGKLNRHDVILVRKSLDVILKRFYVFPDIFDDSEY